MRLQHQARRTAGLEPICQRDAVEFASQDVVGTVDVGIEGAVEQALDRVRVKRSDRKWTSQPNVLARSRLGFGLDLQLDLQVVAADPLTWFKLARERHAKVAELQRQVA
jgi:hypothetical protein